VQTICQRTGKTGSAVKRRAGTGRPKSARIYGRDEHAARLESNFSKVVQQHYVGEVNIVEIGQNM